PKAEIRRPKSKKRSRGDFVAGHFGGVADEEFAVGDGRDVPSFAVKSREVGQFAELIGHGLDQGQFAFRGKDDEVAVGEKQLAVAIMAILPVTLTSGGIETC